MLSALTEWNPDDVTLKSILRHFAKIKDLCRHLYRSMADSVYSINFSMTLQTEIL